MKNDLLQLARDEGLDYAILLRKIRLLSEPILVYRVFVDDEREELLRSVKLGGITLSSLRHMVGAEEQQLGYNTLHGVSRHLLLCRAP